MKTLEVEMATEPLSTYAKELGDEILILTLNKEPIAAIVFLRNVDRESFNPEFMKIIESSRRGFRLGRRLSLDEIRKRSQQPDGLVQQAASQDQCILDLAVALCWFCLIFDVDCISCER